MSPLLAAVRQQHFDGAAEVLSTSVDHGQTSAAVIDVRRVDEVFAKAFGPARSVDDIFLLDLRAGRWSKGTAASTFRLW